MTIDEELLKNAFQTYLEKQIPPSRARCPSFEEILGLVDRQGRALRKEELIEHIFQCGPCAKEFELLREIRKQESVLAEGIKRLVQAPPKKGILRNELFHSPLVWRYAVILVGVFIIIGFAKLERDRSMAFRPQFSHERGSISSSPILLKPGRMSSPPYSWAFRWEDSRFPESYKLEIFDEALFPVLTVTDLKTREYRLPETLAVKIPRNGFWFWTVTARFPNGDESASPLQRFAAGD